AGRGAAGAAGFASGTTTGDGAGAALAASTSPLVRRPSLPVPAIAPASSPLSSTSLRTAGPERSSWLAAAAGAGFASAVAGAIFGTDAGFAAAALPSAIWPRIAPTFTVAPSATAISSSVPATGALISSVTLSVSISTSGSSMATASPAFLSQRPTLASVTDSPSAG